MEIPTCIHHTIIIVNDIIDSLHAWSQTHPHGLFQWYNFQVFTQHYFPSFAHIFFHCKHQAIQILPRDHIAQKQCNILDILYVKHTGLSIFYWLNSMFDTIQTSTKYNNEVHLIITWISLKYFPHHIYTSAISYIIANLASIWDFKISLF